MVLIFKQIQNGGLPAAKTVDFYGLRSPVGYWLDERRYEPAATVEKLKIRAMVLVGGHDAEVPPDDFGRWKKALKGNANAELKFYPGLFHLFMPSRATQEGRDVQEDWMRPGHVSPEVVDDIASWLVAKSSH